MFSKSFRSTLTTVITGVFLLITGCGGGGGGGGAVSFPTPTLPAAAVKIDAMNATTIATSAMEFTNAISLFTAFKNEAPPSILQVINLVIDQVTKRNRSSLLVATRTEDISAGLCVSGKAIANFDETESSLSGTVTITNCDIGGIVVDGRLSIVASWNDTTLDYNNHVGGTLTFDCGCAGIITVVMNTIESGNDGTGNFSSDINFSLDGLPDGGFLVTTDKDDLWTGNFYSFDFTSGTLIVEGANFTFLNIIVVPPNMADVWLDEGLGGSYFTTISISP